jgi:putative CocE/NonD family hydrolase
MIYFDCNVRIRSTRIILILFLLLPLISLNAQDIEKDYNIKFNQKIPMRDGVHLSATILFPSPKKEPLPALFVFTPYSKDRVLPQAQYFTKKDYIVVVADIRGRGDSEGSTLFLDTLNGKDGSDICDWISKQPWCNGKIGMFGGSYLGMVQWQILKENSSILKTIVPTASVAPGIDFPFRNNIFYMSMACWLVLVNGRNMNSNAILSNNDFWNSVFRLHYMGEKPYNELMKSSGLRSEEFNIWMQHPTFDSYWDEMLPEPHDYENLDIPILTITGYYDDDQKGALHYYRNFMKYAQSEEKKNHYIIIGPWNHSGTRQPMREIYDLKFGDRAVIDMNKIQLDWFNWTLKGRSQPEFLKGRVSYFVMGENKWYYAENLDEISNDSLTLYLSSSDGIASDIFHSGYLGKSAFSEQKPDIISYDPLDSTYFSSYLKDGPWADMCLYMNSEAYKKNQLIYHSGPLPQDLVIAGQINFSAYIGTNVKDTDFEYLLYEVKPEGSEIFLTTELLRARYRNLLSEEELITPGKIQKYNFTSSFFLVRKLQKGSRIRFIFRALNNPFWQKNFNSGGKVEEETVKDAKIATIKLYHDKDHPSFIEIPICK